MCYRPITIYKNIDYKDFPEGLKVECYTCLECLNMRKREIALRAQHEVECGFDKIDFLTATYEDKKAKILENGLTTLEKDKIKRIRDKIYSHMYRKYYKKKNFEWHKFKYIIAGEYGSKGTLRAHYHITYMAKSESQQKELRKLWKKYWIYGDLRIDKDVGTKAISYTVGYTVKKIAGTKIIGKRDEKNDLREQTFIMRSKSMGKEWIKKNGKRIARQGFIAINGKKGVIEGRIPKYYIKEMEKNGDVNELWLRVRRENIQERREAEINEWWDKNLYKALVNAGKGKEYKDEKYKRNKEFEIEYEEIDGEKKIFRNWWNTTNNNIKLWRNNQREEYEKMLFRNKQKIAKQKLLQKAQKRNKW